MLRRKGRETRESRDEDDHRRSLKRALASRKESAKDDEEMAVGELQLAPDDRGLPDPSAHPGRKKGVETVTLRLKPFWILHKLKRL